MAKYVPRLDLAALVAIDVHTHAETSSRQPRDPCSIIFDEAMAKYFRETARPTIPEVARYYRQRKMAAVIFPVDTEAEMGHWRIANEEVAELASEHSDALIPFASIDPAKGKMGVREARRLIEEYGVRGFKFHPSAQGFYPNDRKAYGLYEVIAGAGLPALFHTGQTGVGANMPGGGGIRLKYSNPIYLDDVAVDFPSLTIILAHPSFPWQDEALAVATHKPQVHIDLSGWSPKYFPANLVQYANTLLKHKVLFGSDFPVFTPDRWLADFATVNIKPEVRPLILKENAIKLLKLGDTEV
ncbi:MAG: amidohydrolase [Proteobacteria bacterium]|nr:amidohydrolase [Pseudomonadota bacterium]MBI3496245.1 amidohydrolase [Pseudomonadota bacterium]